MCLKPMKYLLLLHRITDAKDDETYLVGIALVAR